MTPREQRGRVNAANSMYSSLIRGLAVLTVGLLASNGDPFPIFLLLAASFIVAMLITALAPKFLR